MDRKAFNFYKSYYDIALELSDEDRYQFLMAVIEMQFTGKCRELNGMAKFAFVSQKHSIEAQINGFEHGKKGGYKAHKNDPYKGGYKEPYPQEKGQVQEKEKEQGERIVSLGKSGDQIPKFKLKSKYANQNHYIVNGVDGFKQLVELEQMTVAKSDEPYLQKFMREKDGAVLEGGIDYAINSLKFYINSQFK